MQFKKTIAAGTVALLLATGAFAFAGSDDNKSKRQARMIEKISKELSLNDAQKSKLLAITEEVKTHRQEQRKLTKENMRDLLAQEKISKEEALQIIDTRKALRAKMQEFMAEKLVEFHAVLDSSQKQKIAALSPRIFGGKKSGRKGGHFGRKSHDYDDYDSH